MTAPTLKQSSNPTVQRSMNSPKTRKEILQNIVIAIDGPSGSGKTTTAMELARQLGLRHLDTGAMYRAVTLKALRRSEDPDDAEAMGRLAGDAVIEFAENPGSQQKVLLDGEDVTEAVRSGDVTRNVSLVSSHASVRTAMVRRQRALADLGGVVLEGRDIGSVVLPGADVKIYLDASVDVRASRRFKELQGRGVTTDPDTVRRNIEERDRLDATRDVSPLTIPIGACVVDTTHLSIVDQTAAVRRIAEDTAERIAEVVVPRGGENQFRKKRFGYAMAYAAVLLATRLLWGIRVLRKDHRDYAEAQIYASNHRSNVDPPIVGSTLSREVHYVAKRSLFKNKILGGLIGYYNAVPIRRAVFDRGGMDRCLRLLESGRSILIFPEGSRVAGDHLGKPRAGVGYLALKSGRPVVPVYVEGTNRLRLAMVRRPPVTVIQGRPIRFTDADLSKYQSPEDFREFGQMVMTAIAALKDEYERNRNDLVG